VARPVAATPHLNAGTTALYRGTLQLDVSRARRSEALSWAVPALRAATVVDPGNSAALRNLALALAASGYDRDEVRRVVDEALAHTRREDRDAMFGVGRAYAAAGVWNEAIAVWTEIGAGPQLLRAGRQLAQGPDWETGITALLAAAKVGAPGRSAPDAITRTALAHGATAEGAIDRIWPLVKTGGTVEYYARLQMAHVYRLAGHLELAEMALVDASVVGRDEQLELERGLLRLRQERIPEAESLLRWAVAHPSEPPQAIPEGDDPHYWLAVVLARQGNHAEAVSVAREGLAQLPSEQGSLRVPYQTLLGESLLALGKPNEALVAFRAGQRIEPNNPRLADGIARARAALGQ
jgi:tetratricopeptide (TPR) repeat protein